MAINRLTLALGAVAVITSCKTPATKVADERVGIDSRVDCTAATIRRARDDARKMLDAGDARGAAAHLGSLACYFDGNASHEDQQQQAWRIHDLAQALYRAGDYRGCAQLAEPHVSPYAGNVASSFDDDEPVMAAIGEIASACSTQVLAAFSRFDSAGCTLSEDAHGIPPTLLDSGTTAACLVLEPGPMNDEGEWQPGAIVLLESATGATRRTSLSYPDEVADDSCNVDNVAFAREDGALLVLFSGGGNSCGGGTAVEEFYIVARLAGTTWTVVDRYRISHH